MCFFAIGFSCESEVGRVCIVGFTDKTFALKEKTLASNDLIGLRHATLAQLKLTKCQKQVFGTPATSKLLNARSVAKFGK